MNGEREKYAQMTETPIPKLISKLAIPTILSMLVTSLYNMADTYFMGQIKGTQDQITSATGAVSVVFSLMAIIQACGFFFGQGSGNFISRELGNKNQIAAEKMASFGFFSAIFLGVIIAVLGLVFIEPLAYVLGSTDTILPYAKDYMLYILFAAPFMCGSLVLNNQLRFQGNAFISMIGIISGAVINVGLDGLFVIVLNMGTAGAGLATAIGQTCGFVILYIGMLLGNNVKIKLKMYKFNLFHVKEIFRGGTPSLARQGLSSISTLSLNFAAKLCGGDPTIAAMGIVSRIMMFCFSAALGFGQGFQPVCGYNYGAKKYGRVKEGYFFCLKIGGVAVFTVSMLIFIFSSKLIWLFNKDQAVIDIGTVALRIQCVAFQFISMITFTNMMLQTIGRVIPATILSMARNGIFFLPLVFVLPSLFNLQGLYFVQPIADLGAFILSLFFGIKEIRRLNKLIEEDNNAIQSVDMEK